MNSLERSQIKSLNRVYGFCKSFRDPKRKEKKKKCVGGVDKGWISTGSAEIVVALASVEILLQVPNDLRYFHLWLLDEQKPWNIPKEVHNKKLRDLAKSLANLVTKINDLAF